MYLSFPEDTLISIDGISEPAEFFAHLPELLPSEKYIIGLASYIPNKIVGRWLKSLPYLRIPQKYNFRFLTKINSGNRLGGAYYLGRLGKDLSESYHWRNRWNMRLYFVLM